MARKKDPTELKEVRVRITEGESLYAEEPLSNSDEAVRIMSSEMAKYDREVVCVVNLNSALKPINFHIVSVGTLDFSPVELGNLFKTAILSNARSFIMLHNHPTGDPSPSPDDISLTERVIEAGKLISIPCLDHIIVGTGTMATYSFRDKGTLDFERKYKPRKKKTAAAEGRAVYGERRNNMAENKREEITIKFGRGLAEPFTSKSGKEFMRIMIPNEDRDDKTPWKSFVLPARSVHENKYGKGLWAKLPADSYTTVTKPYEAQTGDGRTEWINEEAQIPNRELKAMVESYKERYREHEDRQVGDRETRSCDDKEPYHRADGFRKEDSRDYSRRDGQSRDSVRGQLGEKRQEARERPGQTERKPWERSRER